MGYIDIDINKYEYLAGGTYVDIDINIYVYLP
jgi:hypothetical protein